MEQFVGYAGDVAETVYLLCAR